MNVLSLFDGMSCGQLALKRAGIEYDNYFASEIKPHAIKVTKNNFPKTIHIGDVTKVHYWRGTLYTESGNYEVGKIDLLIGGSPCQDFSFLNSYKKDPTTYGLNGEKSKLFHEFNRLRIETNCDNFLLENVKMKKDSELELNKYLGVEGIHINSSLVSAQNRKRIYWTNIPGVTSPIDKKISLQTILERDPEKLKSFKVTKSPSRDKMCYGGKCKNITNLNKSSCLTTKVDRWNNAGVLEFEDYFRFLTTTECERLQTVPDGYTSCITKSQAYDLLGDGWTVDVIAHILRFLNSKQPTTKLEYNVFSLNDF